MALKPEDLASATSVTPASSRTTAHTPGPWGRDAAQIIAADDVWVAEVIQRGRPTAPENPTEVEANARLIAAAPELLAAIKGQTCTYCGYRFGAPREQGTCSTCAPVTAAIAKAEGR